MKTELPAPSRQGGGTHNRLQFAPWRESRARLVITTALLLLAPQLIAQTSATFEVAQVPGPIPRNIAIMRSSRTPEQIAFQTAQVAELIAFAYGFPPDRVERRPQWMYDDFYDVAVTTATPASLPEQKVLLQKLLEERFSLVVHRISTPSPVYFLVRGAKVNLTESEEADSVEISGPVQVRPHLGRHVSMSDLADWLYSQAKLPVLDKTGITGWFDIQMAMPVRGGTEATIRALQNQLGLDLQVQHGTAETLIIDHVEKPRQN
jgi:uncharacterized protein (TIGR03435 family)